MGSQQFCLKWNNHQSNLIDVFDELLENESFVDVTLACEGSSLKAHKVVLSACSPFFKALLKENPCKHPIIIMKDMKYNELKSILQFMYKGEVSISQDQLSSLLQAAETLKVKGLAEVYRNQQRQAESIPADLPYESPLSTINPYKKKRKRPNDEVLHVEPKSKLESSLLGELGCSESLKNSKEIPLNNNNDIKCNYILDANGSSEYSTNSLSPPGHSLPLGTPEIDPTLTNAHHNPHKNLSPHVIHSQFSDLSAQDLSDDLDEIEQKPLAYHSSPSEDSGSRTHDSESILERSLKQGNDSSPDITAAAIATQVSDGTKPELRRQCHICHKVLKSAQINRHIRAIHMNARFECKFCPAVFNDRSNLNRHTKTHYNVSLTPIVEGAGAKRDDNDNILSIESISIKHEVDIAPSGQT